MIRSIVFDLDDTLCDYAEAKGRALEAVCELISQEGCDSTEFMRRYAKVEPPLFRSFATGSLSREQYRLRRFSDALTGALSSQARKLNELYMSLANGQARLFDEVPAVIAELRRRSIACAVLSNGPSDGQKLKAANCGLTKLIDRIFISEEIGAAKPSQESFFTVARALNHDPAEIMIVGDSWEEDVMGARAVGMTGVLLDRMGTDTHCDSLTIRSLQEIACLLR